MIDVRQQTTDIFGDIASTQRKVFRVSTDRVKKAMGVPPQELYIEGVDATRDIVNYNLKTQKKLGDTILNRLARVDGMPEKAQDMSVKVQNLAQEMVEAQQDLVNNVADLMVKMDPMKASSMVKEALQNPAARVKEAADRVVQMEKDLLNKLTRRGEAAEKEVKKTVAKAAPATPTKTRTKRTTKKATAKKTA